MADKESTEWGSIVSRRLARETGQLPAGKPDAAAENREAATPGEASPSSQTPGNLKEISDAGSVMPAGQPMPGLPVDGPMAPPGVPGGSAGLTQGWAAGAAPASPTPAQGTGGLTQGWATSAPRPQGAGGLTQGWPTGAPQQTGSGGLTQGWPSAAVPALGATAGAGRPSPGASDTEIRWSSTKQGTSPSLVVEQLRNLSAQEEKRAFDILRGAGTRSKKMALLALSIAAALAAAGTVLYFAGVFHGDRELRLAGGVTPPEEEANAPESASPGAGHSKPGDLVAGAGPKASAQDGTEGASTGGETTARLPAAPERLTVNDGPTFQLSPAATPAKWVKSGGLPVDLSRAPTVAGGASP